MKTSKMANLSDKDIVLYALYLLGGWQKRIHTEDIALKCYEIAPSKFSWVKYPQYPDLATVRYALEKCGSLVKGESERKRTVKSIGGRMLTDKGIQWIKSNKGRIERYLGKRLPTGTRLPAERKLKELLKSEAFKKFSEQGEQAEITHAEFAESLICTVNTRPEVLSDRIDQLYSIAEKFEEEEIKHYLNFCKGKFTSLLK